MTTLEPISTQYPSGTRDQDGTNFMVTQSGSFAST